ncbi:MAG TPA: ABC transporter ATP-binding protein [Bradyrhizobium sp.]|nr:ABC transporter ATP-binding protein [Bradyrhizobium sp.]
MTDLLTLAGVHTHIGRYHILHGIDFGVPEGQTTMLLGRNGAGKTTTLRTIMGLWPASSGRISLDGQSIEQSPTPDIARLGVGYVPESMAVFSDLTVKENLILAARDGPLDDVRLEWIFGFFPALKRFWLSRAGALSGGQKQMLSIARADAILDKVALGGRRSVPATALSHGDQRKLEVALMMALEPKVFMFDEPTAGMSIDEVPVVLNLIAQLKQDASKIILLVEHKMDVVRSLADRIIVLHNGQLVADGKPAEVIASPIVQEAYLGIAPGKSAA